MKYILLLFICIPKMLFAQQKLNGKIIADNLPIEDAIVLNNTTKQSTTTNSNGEFILEASPNDILIIASPQIEGIEIKLFSYSFLQTPLHIKVKLKSKLLDEVKVQTVTTKMVGIPQPVKTYTQAERKLRTAGDLKWYSPLLIPVGGMSIDGLLNKLSGRTAMLKKELQVERYETNYKKLKSIYPEEFYTQTLQIQPEYVDGFLIYASENPNVNSVLLSKNQAQLKFVLIELTIKFKDLISKNNVFFLNEKH